MKSPRITPDTHNLVILTGRLNHLENIDTQWYCIMDYSTCQGVEKLVQLNFHKDLPVFQCMNERIIRIIGALRTDEIGDEYIFVSDYEVLNYNRKELKTRPNGWDEEWPIKGMRYAGE